MKTAIPLRLSHIPSIECLTEMFVTFPSDDPQPLQPISTGFRSFEKFDDRTHKLVIRSTKRVVPSSVVKRLVGEKAAAWFEQTGYQPGRKTLREFKDQAIDELLPKAFLADSLHTVYLVDTLALFSSKLAAEFFTDALRRTTDDQITGEHVSLAYPLADLPETKAKFPGVLTEWATDEPPEPFSLGDRVKAKGGDSSVSFQSPSILTEFPKVANAERHVSELKLLSENASFVLTEQFNLKSIKLAPEYRSDDFLTAKELANIVDKLIEVLK